MSQKITIRLKQYGDNAGMDDVGEIEIPDNSRPVKSIEWVPGEKFYRLGKVRVEFSEEAS